MIEEKKYEEMSNKQRVCYLLCNRSSGDCKSDMGPICSEYSSSFEDLSSEFRVNDFDPDAWEIEEENDDEEACEDCNKQINIKTSSKSK